MQLFAIFAKKKKSKKKNYCIKHEIQTIQESSPSCKPVSFYTGTRHTAAAQWKFLLVLLHFLAIEEVNFD